MIGDRTMPNSTTQPPTTPVWMITGCSTGFGRELACQLLERGCRVVLTARDPGTIRELAAAYPQSALAVALDVTKKPDIDRALLASQRAFGSIDVLVNNAGYGYYASVEEGDEAAVRAMFETNFFGLVALTKALLPSMRARGSGFIVNISSVGGLVAHPGSGYYAASKFAVEGLSEALSKEVGPLGIRVLLVEPGPFRTRFVENSQGARSVRIPDYADTVGARRATVQASRGKQPGDPARAAMAIIAAVQSPSPPLRLVLGAQALGHIRAKLKSLAQEIDTWEATTLASDYPS
jgi:NAD(P)-dependent dehydrogenase (short-subunit alcohol dehydrogenase family)